MISSQSFRSGVMGLVLLAVTPFLFAAEEPSRSAIEVESLSDRPAGSREAQIEYRAPIEEEPAPAPAANAGETYYQLQLLQQDVLELRGLVEELTYQLRRMQTTQEDRYLELDARFQNLQSQINSGAVATEFAETPMPAAEVPDPSEVVSSEGTEDEIYGTALELIRNRQYDLAIEQLDALIAQYPDGALTANAYYWLGEVHAAKPEPDYEQARQALAQVITFFPDSRKVPDAAFKLGKVYHLMGECERAEELLNQVIADNPGRSVAKLAETYLRDKVDCGG